MKKKIVVPAILLGLLVMGILSLRYATFPNKEEFLVIWGKLANENDQCIILVLVPGRQETKMPVIGEPSCNYAQAYIQGIPHLVHVQENPGVIKIYDVTSEGNLVTTHNISLDGVKITSFPQWENDKHFYISGILADREQIFQVDSESGKFSPFIYSNSDALTLPTISPDGRFLKYVRFAGKNNSFECRLDCYSYFSLVNLDTGEDKELVPIFEPVVNNPTFTHCHELWSPNSQYLAFNVGCGSEFPQEVVIMDINFQITALISPSLQGSGVDPISWFSDAELLIGKSIEVSQSFPYRYFVYSIDTNTGQELSIFDAEGSITPIYNTDVTKGGSRIVGTSIGSTPDGQTQSIVIGKIVENRTQLQSEQGDRYNNHPLWSSSGNWVAYAFAEDNFSYVEDGPSIGIMNAEGTVIMETKDTVFNERSLGYGWFESR